MNFSKLMLKHDIANHVVWSATLSSVALSISNNIPLSIAVGIVPGLAKEVYDKVSGKGVPSFKDIIAGAFGVALVVVPYYIIGG